MAATEVLKYLMCKVPTLRASLIAQETCRQKQGSHNYVETEWMQNEAEARQAFNSISTEHEKGGDGFAVNPASKSEGVTVQFQEEAANIQAGHCRMNMSNSTHLGRIVSYLGIAALDDKKRAAYALQL